MTLKKVVNYLFDNTMALFTSPSEESEREEFGYYSVLPVPYMFRTFMDFIINRILKKHGLVKWYYYSEHYDPTILVFPPSKWEVGNEMHRAMRRFYSRRFMWRNRRRNLRRKVV